MNLEAYFVMNLRVISSTLAMLGFLVSCGQEQGNSSFRSPVQQGSLSADQVPQMTGNLDNNGHLVIPNKVSSTWSGANLLGNSRYEVRALD